MEIGLTSIGRRHSSRGLPFGGAAPARRRGLAASSITQLSTVSGGSLVTAAIFAKSQMRWPSSVDYRDKLYSRLRSLLTTSDLLSFSSIGWAGLLRFNGRLLSHRAQVLSELLVDRWGVTAGLWDLPDRPHWWINTTCLETGTNWRFSKREMGDWQLGATTNRRSSSRRPLRHQLQFRTRSAHFDYSFPPMDGIVPIPQLVALSKSGRHRAYRCVFGTAAPTRTLA